MLCIRCCFSCQVVSQSQSVPEISGPHISRSPRHFNLLVKLTSGLGSSHLNKTTLFRCVNSYPAVHTVYSKRFTRWPTLQPISSLSFHTWTGAFKNRFIQHFHFNFHFQVNSSPTPQLEFCFPSLSFFHLNWQFRSFICYFSFSVFCFFFITSLPDWPHLNNSSKYPAAGTYFLFWSVYFIQLYSLHACLNVPHILANLNWRLSHHMLTSLNIQLAVQHAHHFAEKLLMPRQRDVSRSKGQHTHLPHTLIKTHLKYNLLHI